jgi:hypothetical protein
MERVRREMLSGAARVWEVADSARQPQISRIYRPTTRNASRFGFGEEWRGCFIWRGHKGSGMYDSGQKFGFVRVAGQLALATVMDQVAKIVILYLGAI